MKRSMFLPVLAAASGVLGSVSAYAVDPVTASEAFTTAAAASTGFGPAMWGLAAGTVAIMIGVKWVKRARGAS